MLTNFVSEVLTMGHVGRKHFRTGRGIGWSGTKGGNLGPTALCLLHLDGKNDLLVSASGVRWSCEDFPRRLLHYSGLSRTVTDLFGWVEV